MYKFPFAPLRLSVLSGFRVTIFVVTSNSKFRIHKRRRGDPPPSSPFAPPRPSPRYSLRSCSGEVDDHLLRKFANQRAPPPASADALQGEAGRGHFARPNLKLLSKPQDCINLVGATMFGALAPPTRSRGWGPLPPVCGPIERKYVPEGGHAAERPQT